MLVLRSVRRSPAKSIAAISQAWRFEFSNTLRRIASVPTNFLLMVGAELNAPHQKVWLVEELRTRANNGREYLFSGGRRSRRRPLDRREADRKGAWHLLRWFRRPFGSETKVRSECHIERDRPRRSKPNGWFPWDAALDICEARSIPVPNPDCYHSTICSWWRDLRRWGSRKGNRGRSAGSRLRSRTPTRPAEVARGASAEQTARVRR